MAGFKASNHIGNLKSLSGMVSNQCFNAKAVFHLLKAIDIGIQDASIDDNLLFLSWMHSLFHEISMKCINHQSNPVRSSNEEISISIEVTLVNFFPF
jgi:hypothetical protein